MEHARLNTLSDGFLSVVLPWRKYPGLGLRKADLIDLDAALRPLAQVVPEAEVDASRLEDAMKLVTTSLELLESTTARDLQAAARTAGDTALCVRPAQLARPDRGGENLVVIHLDTLGGLVGGVRSALGLRPGQSSEHPAVALCERWYRLLAEASA